MRKANVVALLLSSIFVLGPMTLFAAQRPATVLLITSGELADSWKDFVHWKTRQGKAAKIITVEQIEKGYKGDDVQQKIRACVLEHIKKHGTRWVVLGGDSQPGGKGHVPDRDTPHASMGYKDIPTDVYYLSRKSWDANGDGVYGDWKNDREAIEYTHPQASIGRIPVRTAADVRAYTQKVIGYESRYPGKNFARKLVCTCPMPIAEPKLNRSWKDYIGPNWKGGEFLRFYRGKTPWDKDKPGDYDLTPEHWLKMLNDKTTGKLHMHGHGFLPLWVLEDSKSVTNATVEKLTNRDAYPVITTVSCFTGHYDAEQDPSIAEKMLRQPGAGAVLVIAPSREGVPIFHSRDDFRLMITEGKLDGTTQTLARFWMHGLSKNLTAGEAFAAAKSDMLKDAKKTAGYHWCQCELSLLGDPTLDLRANDPVKPKLKHPASIGKGPQSLTIRTETPGVTVCVWKGAEIYQTAKTDEQGVATFRLNPKTSGELLITAYGPSVNTALGKISIP